jgi:competence protein ComEA
MMNRLQRWFGWLACWVWWPLVGKSLGWGAAIVVLAHIGSGAALGMGRGRRAPLAAQVADASVTGEKQLAAAPPSSCSSAAAGAGTTADGKVILNQATVADLRKLPGIGQKRAEAILALRARLGGRFRSVRELLRVKGIGPRSLKRLEPKIVLDAP